MHTLKYKGVYSYSFKSKCPNVLNAVSNELTAIL